MAHRGLRKPAHQGSGDALLTVERPAPAPSMIRKEVASLPALSWSWLWRSLFLVQGLVVVHLLRYRCSNAPAVASSSKAELARKPEVPYSKQRYRSSPSKGKQPTKTTRFEILKQTSAHVSAKGGVPSVLVTTKTKPPFEMFVYPAETDRYISHSLIANGLYEEPTTSLIQDLFPDRHGGGGGGGEEGDDEDKDDGGDGNDNGGDVQFVLDLGSNLGYYSLLLAARGYTCVTFEASPDTAWLQRSSASLNGWLVPPRELAARIESWKRGDGDDGKLFESRHGSLTLVDKGVSDKPSTGRLSRHPLSPGMTTFGEAKQYDLRKGEDGSALDEEIPLVLAQSVLEQMGINGLSKSGGQTGGTEKRRVRLRLLKIDVEGFELKALKGLDLDEYPFEQIVMEYFPSMLRTATATDPVGLLWYIASHGYEFQRIGGGGNLVKDKMDWRKEKEVRDWAEGMEKASGSKDFHVNLLARRIKK